MFCFTSYKNEAFCIIVNLPKFLSLFWRSSPFASENAAGCNPNVEVVL
jgi:hypothetical protein